MTTTIETSMHINANYNDVWNIVSTLDQYYHWNSATHFDRPASKLNKQPMRVKLLGVWLSVPITIQTLDKNEGLRWKGGIPYIFTGSHYFKVLPTNNNNTKFIQGEDFSGILVPILLPLLKSTLDKLYSTINHDLSKHAENTV